MVRPHSKDGFAFLRLLSGTRGRNFLVWFLGFVLSSADALSQCRANRFPLLTLGDFSASIRSHVYAVWLLILLEDQVLLDHLYFTWPFRLAREAGSPSELLCCRGWPWTFDLLFSPSKYFAYCLHVLPYWRLYQRLRAWQPGALPIALRPHPCCFTPPAVGNFHFV